MKTLIHISSINKGAIVLFPKSPFMYMKVCDKEQNEGVVRLYKGIYINVKDLELYGLGEMCQIVAKNIDSLYYDEE